MKDPGSRVGAIRDTSGDSVNLFGYGVYDGYRTHPVLGFPNPHITLDNGNEVWGCECWWGDEGKVKDSIVGRKINIVEVPTPKEARTEA